MLQHNTPKWKIALIIILAITAIFVNYWFMTHANAEDQPCWVLCQPNSWVVARMNPKKKSMELGRLECGDMIYTDGKTKNGFLHVWGLTFEMGEGWVHKGYIVFDEPKVPYLTETQIKSDGRVAARKTINGKRRCWLKDGQPIKVYMMSETWAVTNKGFVKSQYIDTGR